MRKAFLYLVTGLLALGCAKVEESAVLSSETNALSGIIPNEGVPAPAGDPVTVYAGLAGEPAETRARLEAGESAASVLWTRGDTFRCLYDFDGDGHYYTDFTTEDDGVTTAAFSTSVVLSGTTGFHCFYPVNTNVAVLSDGTFLYGFNLPVTQHAVAGGIEEGLNRAFAYADQLTGTLDEPLTFHNAISLVKFRMDGAIVPQVKEITLTGSGALAGDFAFYSADGIPTEYPGITFTGASQSVKVVLKGDFQADTDYFIAVWPRQLPWFRMVFSDGNASSTVKQSSKSVTFERSRIKDLGTIHLGDRFADADDGSMEPIKYMTATEGTKPVTIAVIPEGFTKAEMAKYEQLAKSGLDALFNTEPYKTYRKRFNAYILKVASLESGASATDGNGNIIKPVATAFNVRWGQNSYGDMIADPETVFDFVAAKCPDIVNGIHPIEEVPVLMIINDSRYGGRCSSFSNGLGYAMVPYSYDGDGISWKYPDVSPSTDEPLPAPVDENVLKANYHTTTAAEYAEVGENKGDWRNTLVHEFGGHCFGRLGDEYWQDGYLNYSDNPVVGLDWPVPFSRNVSSSPASALWKPMLDQLDNLTQVDPRYGRIGMYQGGDNFLFGRWRNEKVSCMIDNRFYFSAWQRYLIGLRIFQLSGDEAVFTDQYFCDHDVTLDPVRDAVSSGAPGEAGGHRTYRPAGPLPPPLLVEL